MAEKIKSYARVTLRGPKGCGKSFTAAVLFIYLQEKKACLYLCPKSLYNNPLTKSYFLAFLDRHTDLIGEDYQRLHESFASYKEECLGNIVVELISCFIEENDLYLFIDFSDIASYVETPAVLDDLMNCVAIGSLKEHLTTITSYSSGVSAIKLNPRLPKTMALKFHQILSRSWDTLHITGFTSEETDLFIKEKGVSLKPEEVKVIGGTNPGLLSLLDKNDDLHQYSSKVNIEMEAFLERNLHLKRKVESVKEFLDLNNWDACHKYIHYACRGEKLTEQEYHSFHKTWLYYNEVTVERDRQLTFNFPGLGLLLNQIFRQFMTEIVTTQQLSAKHPSVAGYLLEEVFYQYCNKMGKLEASCISLESDDEFTVTLFPQLVLDDFCNYYASDCLYELYTRHPVIDCVGYISSVVQGCTTKYLALIQLSLQRYQSHTKMSEAFRKLPNQCRVPEDMKNLSVFDFYLKLGKLKDEDNILFIYISPEETEVKPLLQSIKSDIKPVAQQYANCIKNKIHFGAIPHESQLYSEMGQFRKIN